MREESQESEEGGDRLEEKSENGCGTRAVSDGGGQR